MLGWHAVSEKKGALLAFLPEKISLVYFFSLFITEHYIHMFHESARYAVTG
jgi:hypothetical protein